MAIAFFDLDRTLLAVNSATLWLRRELRLGHIRRRQALRAGTWVLRYRLGFVSVDRVLVKAITELAGTSSRHVAERTAEFYAECIRELIRPGGRRALDWHRARGDACVLLTSSSSYLSELVAKDLQLDAVLCNRFEVDPTGFHTGRPLGTVCFGDGKREHAERYAAAEGVPLSDCTFYTDSYADVPVMEVVGRAVAVNPDRRLRRLAARRGWEIVDWGVPMAGEPVLALG